MKFRRIIYIGGAFFLVIVKFAIDVINKNIGLELPGLGVLRELLVIGAFTLVAFAVRVVDDRRMVHSVRRLGILLVAVVGLLGLLGALSAIPLNGFDAKNFQLVPLDYATIFVGSLVSVVLGLFFIGVLIIVRTLIYAHRTRSTVRNFVILLVLVALTALSAAFKRPLESSLITNILFSLGVMAAVVNSFRLQWIAYLAKREKIFTLVYGFLLFVVFAAATVWTTQGTLLHRSVLYYSAPLREFVGLMGVFATIFFGVTFVSTLFHLPTADAFDRKRSELTSLHTLGKLITQVFDIRELADTVTGMTLQVAEGGSAWLEIIHRPDDHAARPADEGWFIEAGVRIQVVGMKNIALDEIAHLMSLSDRSLRDVVLQERRRIVIDDLEADPHFKGRGKPLRPIGTIVSVPLVFHEGVAGILYATRETPYGFASDDVDVISAFADQATIAVENSRLIKRSIERERLDQEMALAREMQRKLLPQVLPRYRSLEIEAASTPAFEVGGDYYDLVELPDGLVGVVVGDVSGKGVPAAFYMSEVKGIFQSLSPLYHSPKEFLVRANDVLCRSIDKHSFVSLLYATVDVRSGRLQLARAGHCPLLLLSGDRVEYVRPDGMGMGLSAGATFADAVQELTLRLLPGDVCILYTDGVTEARRGEEEFGYERLLAVARSSRHRDAAGIKEQILGAVRDFVDGQASHDDMTLVVLKWLGRASETMHQQESV
jgi:phosphoserine phosphatase RsbU/P